MLEKFDEKIFIEYNLMSFVILLFISFEVSVV